MSDNSQVGLVRCGWAVTDLSIAYHDRQWGVPCHDDRRLFEFLLLEAAQAGLSWETILRRREGYRRAFADFDPVQVARFGPQDIARLLADPGIIRNRLKVHAAINTARLFLESQKEFGGFDTFIWRFVNGRPMEHQLHTPRDVPVQTPESVRMSQDLKKRGFSFVGPTICYAFMQAVGMVNDHLVSCFRHQQVKDAAHLPPCQSHLPFS